MADPKTQIHDTKPPWYWPFSKKPGKAVDITLPVEEGDRYKLKEITFTGNKAVADTRALRAQFKIKDGDIFDTEAVRKGLENLRKAYAALGYINFAPVPNTDANDETHEITLKIDLDEGKQFFVRRIEFQGNTTTRDKVIRRELALEEGQVYNGNLWELSLLRLNQLQYFEPLKPEQDSEIKQNPQDATVDILLKVKEKGKNSIGLTGGVSGLSGGFIGVNYTTNNLFGKGESLTVQVSVGQYQTERDTVVHSAVSVRSAAAIELDDLPQQLQLQPAAATGSAVRASRSTCRPATRRCCRTTPRPAPAFRPR